MTKKIFTYLIFSAIAVIAFAANPSATKIVEKTLSTIRNAPSITSSMSVTSSGKTMKGSMTLSGDRFAFSSQEMCIWFDGKTLWSYSGNTNEVTLTEPTDEELQEVNPFAYIKAARIGFNHKLISQNAAVNVVELTPKAKSDVKKIVVTINKSSNLPSKIAVTSTSGDLVITLTATKIGKGLSDDTFRFKKANFPNAVIVDLR